MHFGGRVVRPGKGLERDRVVSDADVEVPSRVCLQCLCGQM